MVSKKYSVFNSFIEILIERHAIKYYIQCCGSVSWGSGMGKKSGSGSGIRIRDEQPGSYFKAIFSG
jgi:hypothetical protein